MANFLFYKYRFVKTDDRSLFSLDDSVRVSEESLNTRLYEDLISKMTKGTKTLTLYNFKTDKKGEESSESYGNKILQFAEGVFLLHVRNNKRKKFMPIDKDEAQEIGHYPYTWVIIDTRPDSQAILVQQKKDAFQNPDTVVSLILDCCTRELALPDLGWKLTDEKRLCKGSIWDVVKTRTFNEQDRVKSLCVKIEGKKPNENNAVDVALQTVLTRLSVPEGELKLTSDDAARKILDDTKEDVRNTVDLLIENNYSMRIGFERSGAVEYGKKAAAIYGVSDSVCEEFMRGGGGRIGNEGYPVYDLIAWLDTVITDDSAHEYVKSERRKRNGRRAK